MTLLRYNSVNTRRWPRYHVHLPVVVAASTGAANIVVPGLVSELSRTGMELYGGVNLQPGDLMEVEFQTMGRIRIAGVVRNRSGFCFGLEFRAVRTEQELATEPELAPQPELATEPEAVPEPEALEPEALELEALEDEPAEIEALDSIVLQPPQAHLQEVHQKIDQSLETVLEMRKCREEVERIANALDDWRQGQAQAPMVHKTYTSSPHQAAPTLDSAHFPLQPASRRALRTYLSEITPAVLRCQDGRSVPGRLQVISLAGGLLSLSQPLDQGSQVTLMFLTRRGSVVGMAEMLSPLSWSLQPFKFVRLHDEDEVRLQAAIQRSLDRKRRDYEQMERHRAW
jgi:hypothetical protein